MDQKVFPGILESLGKVRWLQGFGFTGVGLRGPSLGRREFESSAIPVTYDGEGGTVAGMSNSSSRLLLGLRPSFGAGSSVA